MGMFYGHNQNVTLTNYTYGILYNRYAINNINFAPLGWHVPSDVEYATLLDTLGGNNVAGGKLKETGTAHWESPNTGATNLSGFNAFGTGYRSSYGSFEFINYFGIFYTITPGPAINYSNMFLSLYFDSALGGLGSSADDINIGVAVRLIKDNSTNSGSVTDYDGNIYNTIKIGEQVWTTQNWKCIHYNEGTSIPEVTENSEWAALTTSALCVYDNDWNYV